VKQQKNKGNNTKNNSGVRPGPRVAAPALTSRNATTGHIRAATPSIRPVVDRVRAESEEKRRRNTLHRDILGRFLQLRSEPNPGDKELLFDFLFPFEHELEVVRQSLGPFKHQSDPWSLEVWKVLGASNPEGALDRLRMRFRGATADETRRFVSDYVPNPLRRIVLTTEAGPAYSQITDESVRDHISQVVLEFEAGVKPDLRVMIDGGMVRSSGEHPYRVILSDGSSMSLLLDVSIGLGAVPADIQGYWDDVVPFDLSGEAPLVDELEARLAKVSQEDTFRWGLNALRAYKTAYFLGYGETVWARRLIHEWRTKRVSTLAPQAPVNASQTRAPISESVTATLLTISTAHQKSESSESNTTKALGLPPLLTFDLETWQPDEQLLQLLCLASSDLNNLSEVKISRLLPEETRRIIYNPDGRIKDVHDYLRWHRRGLSPAQKSGTIASLCLTVTCLHSASEEDELDLPAMSLRHWMEKYATYKAQSLATGIPHWDAANDYCLAAIELCLSRGGRVEIPFTALLKSCLGLRTEPQSDQGEDLLKSFPVGRLQDDVTRTLARCMLEFGRSHSNEAETLFSRLPSQAQSKLIDALEPIMRLENATFYNCIGSYKQLLNRYHSLIQSASACTSPDAIVSAVQEFHARTDELRFLLSPTDLIHAETLKECGREVDALIRTTDYELQHRAVEAAKHTLRKITDPKGDNQKTTLWATSYRVIAAQWRSALDAEFAALSQFVRPQLVVKLSQRRVTLSHTGEPRAIFEIENVGAGPALDVRLRITSPQAGWEVKEQHLNRHTRIDRGCSAYGYFTLATADLVSQQAGAATGFCYSLNYKDIAGNLESISESSPGCSGLYIENQTAEHFTEIPNNPFVAGPEVSDKEMFVGRDAILQEVITYATDPHSSGLIMLHGQRRVGKSSLLHFLEKRLNDCAAYETVAVTISWAPMSAHDVSRVISRFLTRIQLKVYNLRQYSLPIPTLDEIRESYTFAFTEAMEELKRFGIKRLVLLIDEFDLLADQLEDQKLGFDNRFFSFLRGLTKDGFVTLVLTGSELMPILMDQHGEAFNHAKAWRIEYLHRDDGSVERMLNNVYVRDYIEYDDKAIELVKDATACNPYFLQALCQIIVDRCNRQRCAFVCPLDVIEAAQHLVTNMQASQWKHLYLPLGNFVPEELAVIGAVSEAETERNGAFVSDQTISDRLIGIPSQRVMDILNTLVRREVLTRREVEARSSSARSDVRIRLPLFRNWFQDNKPLYDKWSSLLMHGGVAQ